MSLNACASGAVNVPELDESERVELQVRAVERLCARRGCASEIGVSKAMFPKLRAALREHWDVVELTQEELDDRFRGDGVGVGPSHVLSVEAVSHTEVDAVYSVVVWDDTGSAYGEPILFEWDGSEWIDVDGEDVGVTVTTAVS